MKASISALAALLLGVSAPALLGACGSSTKTVSAAGAPPVSQTTGTGAHSAGSSSTPESTPSTTVGAGGGTPAQATTRTAPEPAFTENEESSGGLSAATAVLRAKGYTAVNTSVYHPNQTLRVLIGTRAGSSDGYGQQAFFFVNGRYIGTDSKVPSATVGVAGQSDTEVTLVYPLYRKGDPLSSPSAGQAKVRFQLNDGQLEPLEEIPPASSAGGRPSRL